ncbi:MAG: hypothetical protein Q9224_005813, partial [Gallowayella concinna]
MFASTFISRLTSSTPQPLLPTSSTQTLPTPYTDIAQPSPTDTTATLLALARQEAHLQSHIQYLLDVQSDRLLEGLGGETAPAPAPSTTPQPSQPHSHHENDSRRSKPAGSKKPTLQGARSELSTAISTLHTLKLQTANIISTDLSHTTASLNHITTLQTKKTHLESTIHELESSSSPRSRELQELAKEEEDLSAKIHSVENTLYEMRARQRVLRQKVSEGRNREEARLSSYRGSLEILEKEVQVAVVAHSRRRRMKPVAVSSRGKSVGSRERGGGREERGEGVWDLPAKRRTLQMVREYYDGEKEVLQGRLKGIEDEMSALEEGGEVWGHVVDEVGKVEG